MKRDYILCPNCGGEVYRYDNLYQHNGETLCQYCLRDYVLDEIKELTDAELVDIFEMREITPSEFVASVIVRGDT